MTSKNMLSKTYDALIAKGQIEEDAAQRAALASFAALTQTLTARRWFFSRAKAARGIYLYGDVGRGKSFLMDLFFAQAGDIKKWRVHFHGFMQETHERLNAMRARGTRDPLPKLAKSLARRARLICFDEFQVQDIADASILGRLFESLWREGVCVVATSNAAPDALYAGGLNRHRFLPFIARLKENMDVIKLESARDYRLARLMSAPTWFSPNNKESCAALDERFSALTALTTPTPTLTSPPTTTPLTIGTRIWHVPSAAGVARLSFDALCAQPRGARDYWQLAQGFHTLIIDDIPALTPPRRNEALRFITLIDVLYEHKVKLLASAECAPDALLQIELPVFARTQSRLYEMQSADYLSLAHFTATSAPS